MKKYIPILGLSALLLSSFSSQAALFSDAAKLGANAGAMEYCKNIDSGDSSKYNLLKIRTLKEYDRLDSGDRAKALIYRKSAEDKGIYLNDPLDKKRCQSIRRTLHITL
jgi:hypothetical protein